MKRTLLCTLGAVLFLSGGLAAHDLFLRLTTFFVPPHTAVEIPLLNGTFERSDNVIERDRMLDVRVVGPGEEVGKPARTQWRDVDTTSRLSIETGPPGTYTVGVSTAPRMIEMTEEKFDSYLKHDGLLDMLEAREAAGRDGSAVHERYSKHVKALMQVGDARSSGFAAVCGYPIEIVPQQNPYALRVGDALQVQVLRDGTPLARQRIYASHGGFHGHDASGGHIEAVQTRTDSEGMATIPLDTVGQWYVRLIHMVVSGDEGVDYESNWATLTFELRPEAAPEPSLSWVSILSLVGGGLLLVVLVFRLWG